MSEGESAFRSLRSKCAGVLDDSEGTSQIPQLYKFGTYDTSLLCVNTYYSGVYTGVRLKCVRVSQRCAVSPIHIGLAQSQTAGDTNFGI